MENIDTLPPGMEERGRRYVARPEVTFGVTRGAARFLRALGFACVVELPLATGRRVDIAALGPRGEIWVVEVKSSVEDFRTDRKWADYRDYCDRLFFAVTAEFPCDLLPGDVGLILADAYDARIMREAPDHRLAGARRKAMTLRIARLAAARLHGLADPPAFGA